MRLRHTALLVALLAVTVVGRTDAQAPPTEVDLTGIFDLGALVGDRNGDSIPDWVRASLVLGPTASVAEVAAASEVAARLGFETMAMDLPVARGLAGEIPIVFGRGGLSVAGVPPTPVDPTSLDAGEGVVAVETTENRTWIFVVGGDDRGLLAAAGLLAGALPHTRTLSSPSIDRVRDDVVSALTQAEVADAIVRVAQARTRVEMEGVSRLVVEIQGAPPQDVADALETLEADGSTMGEADEASTEDAEDVGDALAYPGLGSVEVRITGGETLRFAGRAPPAPPGPVPGRPGAGGKDDLDLSNVYTTDGLLGGGPIPSRVDGMLVPGEGGTGPLPDLAARLGLESTGLTVPMVQTHGSITAPSSRPTMVLVGTENTHTATLADSGLIETDGLAPGEGLLEVVPDAFGSKPALVVTGGDPDGANRALEYLAETSPHLEARGKDRPTLNDVERGFWDALSGHSPVGQAAIARYKLERIAQALGSEPLVSANLLVSVEKADPGLASWIGGEAETLLGVPVEVTVDNRDVLAAAPIFEEALSLPSEVDRFWEILREQVLPGAQGSVRVHARLSEPPEVRARLEEEVRAALVAAGADPASTEVVILSAFKQGYSWLHDSVLPQLRGEAIGEIVVHFRRNDPPAEWPQQAIHTPVRWLHEIFPIDEVYARELGIDLDRIRFEQVTSGPTYSVLATSTSGEVLVDDQFDPKFVLRPYFDRFQDYEHVRVTTGWIEAAVGDRVVADERIVTDPEAFWDYYQATVLPALYDHVMRVHDGLPRGGSADAPFFGELIVELEMSEPDYRLGVDNEIHAPMDALHEEIYFGTIEFFDVLGRNSRGQGLQFPGRIVPVMKPKSDGQAAQGSVRITGFATSRPALVLQYETAEGTTGESRLDIPKTSLARPSVRRARVHAGRPGLASIAMRVRVDTDADMRDSLVATTRELSVDERMVSAEQVTATVKHIEALRAAGLYASALAWDDLGEIEVWAEWSHEQDPDSRRTATLADNGTAPPLPDWRALLPDGWEYEGDRIVQWDTPIPPSEGHEMLAKMTAAFPEATMYRVGRSYLGKDIWAMDLMPPITTSHWSHAKATTYRPTVIYSARQHANEVSSTSHVLRHAELLLTDPEQRPKLDRVNIVVHPFTNPDGAQTAYDLYRLTPDYILHAGYLGPLGQDATSGGGADHPIYPESTVRGRLWDMWLPDIFLNPHGYPSHQVVQLFSEYTGLVRRGRVTERNWGFNKGWFMPGFGYVDSPDFPRHKDAAFTIRDYITRGINSNRDVFDLNQRAYARYRRYGADFDPDVFNLPMTDSVLIEMPLKGSTGQGGGYNPRITIWSGTTEAPDETAYGPWMELVGKAGLSWDQAITDYLFEGQHEVKRSGSTFFGGVTLQMQRPRPPEEPDESEGEEPNEGAAPGEPGSGAGASR